MPQTERNAQGCEGFRQARRWTRRQALHAGSLFGVGLSLMELLRVRARAKPASNGTFGRARSVIMLYLHGGHAQQETWDPKPDGPLPERGEFGAIATIYHLLGVSAETLIHDSLNRPHSLVIGEKIDGLLQ